MTSLIYKLVNLGLTDSISNLEKRRIRLVNLFSLISLVIILFFSVSNIIVGSYDQAIIIASGIFLLSLPSLLLNKYKKYLASRHYFSIISLIIVCASSYNSIFQGQLRFNEFFLIGYAAFIVIMFENPAKAVYFFSSMFLVMGMVTTRNLAVGEPIDSDVIMAYVNILTGFGCIYFFTAVFKSDLVKSNNQLQEASKDLEKQQEILKLQKDEILNNQQLLRTTVDSLPLFISLIDMNGVYKLANAKYESTFAIPIDQLEGKHFKEVLPEKIVEKHEPLIIKGLRGESPKFEMPTPLPNGETIDALGRYIPVHDIHDEQIGLAVYAVDVTKLKATESELIALNDSKNKLLSLISHDIKSPLNSLKGMIDLAENIKEEEFKEFINKISQKLYQVNFSLDNLLNWSKAQMHRFELEFTEVDLISQVYENIEIFDESITSKDLAFKVQHQDDLIIKADRESINLVLRNILSNAIKFSPIGSEIKIDFEVSKDEVVVKVIDEGEGISEDLRTRLLKGSQHIKSNIGTGGETGTGLGICLSIDIVKQNNGTFDINKKGNKGTVVSIGLPKANVIRKKAANV